MARLSCHGVPALQPCSGLRPRRALVVGLCHGVQVHLTVKFRIFNGWRLDIPAVRKIMVVMTSVRLVSHPGPNYGPGKANRNIFKIQQNPNRVLMENFSERETGPRPGEPT